MTPPATGAEQQIAALREEIRRAGRGVGRLRLAMGVGVGCVMLAAMELMFQFGEAHAPELRAAWPAQIVVFCALTCPANFVGCLLAFPAAAALAWTRRRELFRRLSRVPPEFVVEALLPLRGAKRPDTGDLAESLLRELHLAAELEPAATPDARGHEASPAEDAH